MEKLVFTNGCFDILHPGHIDLLERAAALGTRLVVGINSDASVRAIKGRPRPFLDQESRKRILEALECVSEVRIFDEPTPERLIREIAPDVLVKGGDWGTGEIIGADFVRARGGRVHSLPLLEGFSSSGIVGRIRGADEAGPETAGTEGSVAGKTLDEHLKVFEKLSSMLVPEIEAAGQLMAATLLAGNKVLICGNGGSAADAQHIAAELVGRYECERRAFPAVALTTDTSALTALANDYDFERIFARQVEALAVPGDLLIAISTSGNSPNVIAAVMKAREAGCRVIGLTGADGKKLASLCDRAVLVPSARTARIQEAHIAIAHIWCEMLDKQVSDAG